MIRVVLFLVFVACVAVGAAWLADRPGDVTVTWLNHRIETSVMVAAAAILLVAAFAVLFWSIVRAALQSPRRLARVLRDRRRTTAHRAISRGLIAIGAGDARAAQRFAREAGGLSAEEPLALLLSAQTAQLAGDRDGAERAFRAMAARSDTKLLGLRGLYVEAQRRDDAIAARRYAERAAEAAPGLSWAGQAVLQYRTATGDWAGALAALDSLRRGGQVDRDAWRRQRAVLLTARALGAADSDTRAALAFAREAASSCPRPRSGRGARRPPAGGRGRPAQGRQGAGSRLARAAASRSRRDLCAPALGRFGARAPRPRAEPGADAPQSRRIRRSRSPARRSTRRSSLRPARRSRRWRRRRPSAPPC